MFSRARFAILGLLNNISGKNEADCGKLIPWNSTIRSVIRLYVIYIIYEHNIIQLQLIVTIYPYRILCQYTQAISPVYLSSISKQLYYTLDSKWKNSHVTHCIILYNSHKCAIN